MVDVCYAWVQTNLKALIFSLSRKLLSHSVLVYSRIFLDLQKKDCLFHNQTKINEYTCKHILIHVKAFLCWGEFKCLLNNRKNILHPKLSGFTVYTCTDKINIENNTFPFYTIQYRCPLYSTDIHYTVQMSTIQYRYPLYSTDIHYTVHIST